MYYVTCIIIFIDKIKRYIYFFIQNKILWVNKENNTALIEAGIIGQDLEREVSNIYVHF